MADEKISAMTGASAMANADVMPILRLGVNNKITRNAFMVAAAGEQAAWSAVGGGVVGMTVAGDALLQPVAGRSALVNVSGSYGLEISALSTTMTAIPGTPAAMVANGSSVTITAVGQVQIVDVTMAGPTITFVPSTPSDWVIPPNELATAVNRIARALVTFTLLPIP